MDDLEDRVKIVMGGVSRVSQIETRQKGKKYRTRVLEKAGRSKATQTKYFWKGEDEARLGHELIVLACRERSSHSQWPKMALQRIGELQRRLERESHLRRDLERSRPR